MKNLFILISLSFLLLIGACQKEPVNKYEEAFYALPEAPIYSGSLYELQVDSINADLNTYPISGELFFRGTSIWQTEGGYVISVTGKDSLALVKNMVASIGSFYSFLFFRDIDISALARPENFPRICAIRLDGNLVYLLYSDYGSFRRQEEGRYGSYNLETGELKTD